MDEHRRIIDQQTAGRDYHGEHVAEIEKLRCAVVSLQERNKLFMRERDAARNELGSLQEWSNAREAVLEQLALTRAERDAYRDNAEQMNDVASRYLRRAEQAEKERDALRAQIEEWKADASAEP